MRRPLAVLLVPLVLALAGCPGEEENACTQESQKAAALELMRSWYLYADPDPAKNLLASISPTDAEYPRLDDYLWALTQPARDANQDRGWTYATTVQASQQFFAEGTSVGFGIGRLQRDVGGTTREFVSQVFGGSAAAEAEFVRGDEILAIGESEATLVDVQALLAAGTLSAAYGPTTAGVTRTFRVMPVGGTAPVLRTMTKRTYGLDPVPAATVIRREGQAPVGYVALRTFIGPADPLLVEAFAMFELEGIDRVVVDLRYNGGGLVSTADLLSNLLGGQLSGSVMYRLENNALHASQNQQVAFASRAESIAPVRIAFITTGASASASELVPNALEAWNDVALVGAKTYGKPVGQRGFLLEECGTVVYAISFRLVNAEGDGSYFDGLPDAAGNFSGAFCGAGDDLAHAQSDPREASTAAALEWLATGSCPATAAAKPAGPSAALRGAPGQDAYPEPADPDLAQRHVRGLL
jgi:C-terminal processing protease CtpA/Prc